ncbi:MAG: oligosaccharide flippase family protein [Alphaproteobacteria bacterium]
MIKILRHKIKESEFLKNVLTLMTGTGIAVLIPLLASPILTRLYAPKDFAILAIFTVVISLGSVVATCKYEAAIMLPKSRKDAQNLTALSFCMTLFVIFILFWVITFIGRVRFFSYFNAPELADYFHFVLGIIFCSAMIQTMSANLNKAKMYKSMAAIKISATTFSTAGKLFFGVYAFFSLGLVTGLSIGAFAALSIVSYQYFRNIVVFSDITFEKMKEMAIKYKRFPIYNVPSTLITALSANLHIILLLKFFGQETVGVIAFASTLIQAPFSILSYSFSQVYYEKISTIEKKTRLLRAYKKALFHLLPLPFIVVIAFIIAPTRLITVLFGNEWHDLATYFPPLAFWFGAQFIGSAIFTIYTRLEKLQFLFIFYLTDVIFMSAIIYAANLYQINIVNTLYMIASIKTILYVFFCIYAFRVIRESDLA